MLAGIFGVKSDTPTFPATIEEVLSKHPSCELSRKYRAAQASKATRARLDAERQRLQAQRRRAQAVIDSATPESDFAEVARCQAEAEVVQKFLDRLDAEARREGDNTSIASFENVWAVYQLRVSNVVNHREPGIRDTFNTNAPPPPTLEDKIKAVQELLR